MPIAVVRLAGLTFNSGPDGDGDEFVVSNIDGWDAPGIEQTVVERPLSDGGVIAYSRRTSWALTVAGWVLAATSMGEARRKLADALDGIVTADGTLSVDEDDGTYELTVRLAQRLRTRQASDMAITFEADLIAVVPAKTPTGS